MMRTGCSDEELTEAIRGVIWEKPGEHHFTSRVIDEGESRLMSRSAAENKAGGKGRMAETETGNDRSGRRSQQSYGQGKERFAPERTNVS